MHEKVVKIVRAVCGMCTLTDRQTDRQTK